MLLGAPAAASADDVDPLWYFDQMGVQAVHDAGITGEGVTIAVFDTKINLDLVTFAGADIQVQSLGGCPIESTGPLISGHGSSGASLIVGNGTSVVGAGPKGIAPDATILYYNVLDEECQDDEPFEESVRDAIARGADIISMSGGIGAATDRGRGEQQDAVVEALRAGVTIVTGLPNADTVGNAVLDTTNGVVNVSSVDTAGQVQPDRRGEAPLHDENVDVAAPGTDVAGVMDADGPGGWGYASWSGNSAATPLVAGALALAKQKWPDATPSQLVQSLIHNAGDEEDELAWNDAVGYGIVDLPGMIAADPSQYSDENPLFVDDREPTYDEVYTAATPTPTPGISTGSDLGPMIWLFVSGGVILVLAIIIIVAVVSKKRRHQQGADHGV